MMQFWMVLFDIVVDVEVLVGVDVVFDDMMFAD